MDRRYLVTALGYAILGISLGIYMASTKNHIQNVTHAHMLLIGFVISFVYAVCYKLWVANDNSKLVNLQYWLHQVGTIIIIVGLYLMYGNHIASNIIGPVLGVGSILILIAIILMKILVIKNNNV
ncbi:TonB-dependent receptor [Kangiella sp. HZ709]|uniref:TonB-dependent receptor n=1 Tax=Kangiella sp. HZ709 TaxID=2666328 RepID=UPI0012AF69F3|nr:TonB-dependent receptor [Kangiella sp. HZ709]MRX28396.1 TonB-dependent receptor [Kangiella sp. HZ709]